jgi:hypothetical protein
MDLCYEQADGSTLRKTTSAGQPDVCIRKQTRGGCDIVFRPAHSSASFKARISLKSEDPLPSISDADIKNSKSVVVRAHERAEFVSTDHRVRVDLSDVRMGASQKDAMVAPPSYEIEVEAIDRRTTRTSDLLRTFLRVVRANPTDLMCSWRDLGRRAAAGTLSSPPASKNNPRL